MTGDLLVQRFGILVPKRSSPTPRPGQENMSLNVYSSSNPLADEALTPSQTSRTWPKVRGNSESIRATELGVTPCVTVGSSKDKKVDSVLSQAWKDSKRASASGNCSGDFFFAMKFFILNKFLVVNISTAK